MSLTGTVGKDDYGNITEVTSEYDRYYLNQRVAKISLVNDLINEAYLKHYFMQSKVKVFLTKNNRGVRQANISNSDIYELFIPVPDKSSLEVFVSAVSKITKFTASSVDGESGSKALFNSLSQKAFAGQL
jgi:type I restriction enzyme S subunit